MPKMQEKYNLNARLEEANQKYQGSHALLGKSMIGFPQYVNSMRSVMFASHTAQLLTQVFPDFPAFFTGGENVVGKYSSGYKKTKHKYTVFKKIVKFEDIVEHPQIYNLFLFDEDAERFEVIERKPGESLTETYGYEYKNDVIDQLTEDDVIDEGTVLFKSTSYDDDMNYSYGRNVPTVWTLDPFTSEDAAVASDELAPLMVSPKFDEAEATINDNDYPLNTYGDPDDPDDYKVMPDIGEESNGIVLALRRKFNNQEFHDFKTSMLSKVTSTDIKFYLEGTVSDITIYCNADEIPNTTFMKQIKKYYVSQMKYYKKIKKCCEQIKKSGYDYSSDVDYLYKRACDHLDRKRKWKAKDSVPSGLKIVISVQRREGLSLGQKISMRMGNKSVIAKIIPKERMPYYYDTNGVKQYVQLKVNLLAIINRTTSAPLFEQAANFIGRKCQEQLHDLHSRSEKENLLFDIFKMFNEEEYRYLMDKYQGMSEEDKDMFMWYCENVRIHFHQPPIEDDGMDPIFYRLGHIVDKYDWIKPEKTYVYKWGREIQCMQDSYISDVYVIELKQTSKRGFSARNTGAINQRGLPARSNKSKSHLNKESDTAIRFGESENLTFMIGMMPEEVVLFNALYRTSAKARKDIAKGAISGKPVINVDKSYDSRVAELLHVRLRSLGFELLFLDEDDDLAEYDNDEITIFPRGKNGETMLCTAYEKFLYDRRMSIRDEILTEEGIMDADLLNEKIDKIIAEREYIIGDVDWTKPFFANCVEKDPMEGLDDTAIEEEAFKRRVSTASTKFLIEPIEDL